MSNPNFITQGCIMILSGPSGSGKTSLIKKLVTEDQHITRSTSYTTRLPRASEVEGVDYYFIDNNSFSTKVITNQLLEFTEIYGNFYGTPKSIVEEKINAGNDLVVDIDARGARSIKAKMQPHCFTVFILPPSLEELSRRLLSRAQDSQMTIAHRINNAKAEIQTMYEYDYVIMNDNLEKSSAQLKSILAAERLKKSRIKNLEEYVNNLVLM